MKKFFYSVDIKDFNNSYEIETKYQYIDYSVEDVAEEAAEDYYHEHDGWESSWPQIIYVWNEDEEYLGTAEVSMEHLPHFYGYAVETKDD